jgi:ABC-type lipoprotein release transport system permease subunit
VLAKFLFKVSPTDAATLLAVMFLLAAVALIAAWMPARRAAGVDPAVALRYE